MTTTIASRELRNGTAGLLRRVEAGERLRISVNGRAVADLVPIPRLRRPSIPRADLVRMLTETQADASLRVDLAELAGDTTDELGGHLTMTEGLLDTSVFIAAESARPLDASLLPDEAFISVVTSAELRLGVLAARSSTDRARRLATLTSLGDTEVLPVDEAVGARWAELRVLLRDAGRRANVNDLWIAATAAVHGLPVITRDNDFDMLVELGVQVVKV